MKSALKMFLVVLMLGLWLAPQATAVTAWYQPTPYPTQTQSGVHVVSGWLNNSYNQTLVWDDKLQVGGWGDVYRSYINWDLTGLPKDPTNVALWLRFYPSGATVTPFQFCIPNSSWNAAVTWGTQPSLLGCTGVFTAPSTDSWWGVYITPWYQNWQNGIWGKYGLMLNPQYNNNNFDFIRSPKYTSDGYRPILQFDFTPTFEMRMPLPGNLSWAVTTEVGGWDSIGDWYDSAHDGTNYFSIDFSWRNKDANGNTVYFETSNIPVIAATGGKVVFARGGDTAGNPNGFYVVIDHDYDGNLDTGFSTRYLHLKFWPSVTEGSNVAQGDILGYMGSTGKDASGNPTSTGTHLHFGVRYNNDGSSSRSELTKVMMDGWILKSFQSERVNGVYNDRYYRSGNRVY